MGAVAAAVATLCAALMPVSASASAIPASGPRETVELSYSSVLPNAPTGYRYREVYRDPSNPSGPPPAVRAITYTGPRGGRVDSLAAPRCTASDAQLQQDGESACEPGSRTGVGTTTVAIAGLGQMTGEIGLFNGPSQEVDVVKFGGRVSAVVRDHYTANGFTNLVPTCLTGGQPPSGCPSDQVAVVSTDQSAPAVVSGSGASRRSLLTNPPVCPRSGFWHSSFEFRFGDGTVDHVHQRLVCTRPVLSVKRAPGCVARARVTGRDLSEVANVAFFVDGRRFARDSRAPFRARTHLRRGQTHRLVALVHAYGVRIARVHRTIARCR